MTRKFPDRKEAESWVESRLNLKLGHGNYTKESDRHITVYSTIHPYRAVARISLWFESTWLARIV